MLKRYAAPTLTRLASAPAASGCPMCGWQPAADRNGEGHCIDAAACYHRTSLNRRGRPRESACKCAAWPCPCVCHQPHEPEIWLSVTGADGQ